MSLKPVYKIVEIRPFSNAFKVSQQIGGVLININGKPAYNYKLSNIILR
tara:strand:+ start:58418 stop:58564 length:147 start_codon:yes stop_codon:yes gene_type:complete